jgi:hypothetical protein
MVSLQVPQEEYPLTVASGGNCRRSSPYSTSQGYFAELARGLSHASLAHTKSDQGCGRHRGRTYGRSKTQRLRRAGAVITSFVTVKHSQATSDSRRRGQGFDQCHGHGGSFRNPLSSVGSQISLDCLPGSLIRAIGLLSALGIQKGAESFLKL